MQEFTPVKNHVCTECGDKFTKKTSLVLHAIHTSEKPCVQCVVINAQKTSLVVHARIHTGEKPCVYCVVINLLKKLVW